MNEQFKIPKTIHYFWFGKRALPEKAKKCIESWKLYLSDYEIKEWNENNFDININQYVKQAYESKKYAFVSDYARFFVLYMYGGIYMDVDVEVIKPLDSLLNDMAFTGFEDSNGVNPGLVFASVKNTSFLKEILDSYSDRRFINEDGSFNTKTVVEYTTEILIKNGLKLNNQRQNIYDIVIYPTEYFCPLNYKTNKISVTSKTYTIHHYHSSWQSPSQKFKKRLGQIFGDDFLIFLSKIKKWLIR